MVKNYKEINYKDTAKLLYVYNVKLKKIESNIVDRNAMQIDGNLGTVSSRSTWTSTWFDKTGL